MKIKFLGTGQMETARKNTSFVVDNNILFDIGNGVLDSLIENELDTKDIDFVIISHLHTDHFGDIVYFLHRRRMKDGFDKKLTIIGPIDTKQKICTLNELTMPDVIEDVEKTMNIDFVELKDKLYQNKLFELKAFSVVHGPTDCNGYIITKDKLSLGYSGDSSFCDSLVENIKFANTWFIEANDLEEMKNYHVGLNQLQDLALKNKTKKFYTIHRKDYAIRKEVQNLYFPNDKEIVFIKK